ncbi:Septum formation initiator [Desulfovibrio sp. X2]|uniref:FtsB family cell division protein n=1 Tax=Desulfovibrio sp. X2 TaxID=941449 RepID=UPI000358EF83|nr:septum formation initiator family protein [Desulfovibrio sp. X2]EPR42223.1 Septum formation initiator [Desulfovibrio sp. X2]
MVLRRAFLIILLAANVTLLGLVFIGNQGLFAYRDMRARYEDLAAKLKSVDQRSLELSQDIRLLKSDREHMERAVRAQTNFVRDNEILYLFPEQDRASAGDTAGAQIDEK